MPTAAPAVADQAELDLARLDQLCPLALDPAVWERNLAALRAPQFAPPFDCHRLIAAGWASRTRPSLQHVGRVSDPTLADPARRSQAQPDLPHTAWPEHWRPARALDGWPTLRLERAGEPAEWLAGSAAPRTRAAALLRDFVPGEFNPMLPAMGAGAELHELLARLPLDKAVFVVEPRLEVLTAVLSLIDFADALSTAHCVLLPVEQIEEHLTALLEQHPGLLPPANILRLPHVAPERLDHLRQVLERVLPRTVRARAEQIARLSAVGAPTPADATPGAPLADAAPLADVGCVHDAPAVLHQNSPCVVDAPYGLLLPPESAKLVGRAESAKPSLPLPAESAPARLALVSLTANPRAHRACEALASAAKARGEPVCACVLRGPLDAHAAVHAQRLAAFRPQITLFVNQSCRHPPLPTGGVVCEWYLDAAGLPERLADDGTLRLAASPRVARALGNAGCARPRVLEFYWGCDAADDDSPGEPAPGAGVVLIADLPNDDPAACGIEQPTHRRLWKQLQATACELWEQSDISSPQRVLCRAERASGVRLGEELLRERMLRLIERVLIPAAIVGRIGCLIETGSGCLRVIGRGWQRYTTGRCSILAEDLPAQWSGCGGYQPAAAILAGRSDPLSAELLYAGGRAWPLWIHAAGGSTRSIAELLGGVLSPARHYRTFSGAGELRAILRSSAPPTQAELCRARRTREHLRANHSYVRRLEALARTLAHARVADGVQVGCVHSAPI